MSGRIQMRSNDYSVATSTTQDYQMSNLSQPRTIASDPRNTYGVRLRPVSDLR